MRTLPILMLGLLAACSSAPEAPKPDWSTPGAAVKTYFRACEVMDLDVLAECFSTNSEREFKPLRDKTANDAVLEDLRDMFTGAIIDDIHVFEDGASASVKVKLKGGRRDSETLIMVRQGDAWKIRGY